MNYFYIYKSQGDIVYSLPAIQAYGGGVIITGLPMDQYTALKPLIDIQPGVKLVHEKDIDIPCDFINLEEFRYTQNNPTHIVESFSKILGVTPDWKAGWLKGVTPREPGEYAVINITGRYRDKVFSYKKVLDELLYEKKLSVAFVGFIEEWSVFKNKYPNHKISWIKTEDWLIAAQIINGAKYFIGTQSCCLAIAEGLGRSYSYERSPFFDNVMTGRPNETILNNRTRKIHFALSRLQETYRNFLT